MEYRKSYHFELDPSDSGVEALSDVARRVRVSVHVLRNCALIGRKDCRGQRQYLEVCRLPCGVGTSQEAYLRFLRRLNGITLLAAMTAAAQ